MKSKRSQKNPPRNSASVADAPPPIPFPESAPAASPVETSAPPNNEPAVKTPGVLAAKTPQETRPVTEMGSATLPTAAPAPLVSLAAVLDAIHLELPPKKPGIAPAPAVPKVPETVLGAPEKNIEPVQKKVLEPALEKFVEAAIPKSAEPPAVPVVSASPSEKPASQEPKVAEKIPAAPPLAPIAPEFSKAVVSVPKQLPEPALKKIVEPPPEKFSAAPVSITETPAVKIGEPPAPARTPDKKISEKQMVKDLPALEQLKPEPKRDAGPHAPSPRPPAIPTRQIQPMFVVMLTPELAPVAKVGGLGDVVLGLSRELELRGNAVEIILPKYDCMRYHHIHGLVKAYENLQVPWFGSVIHTTVWFGFVHGRKCFFIEPHSPDKFFNRGVYYGQADDVMRFAFFCRAAMEFMFKTGKQPDIIHCHDWQTALAPVLLWEMYERLGMRHSRICFTIHNFKHQGLTGEAVLRATGLNRPEHFFSNDRMRDNGNPQALNLMKAGIVYSNFVTTVSPRHAWEAKDAGQAFGLEPALHTHHGKYGGVLNGLDYDMFNPEKDPYIPSHFNMRTIEKKYDNKRALRKRLWLADNEKPIIAFIGRLDPQKGVELVRHAIFYALNHGAQFVLLGESPDKTINDHFWGLKRHLNDNPDCHLEIGYNDELAHLIYAGADMMVVPSHFEPCGLTQLISLRYGTVPIVRAVGGLADTVFDKDHSHMPLHQRNGYVFPDVTNASMETALVRALGCYYQFPEHFRHLMLNGMNCDYSWNHPGQHYLNIYDYIRDK